MYAKSIQDDMQSLESLFGPDAICTCQMMTKQGLALVLLQLISKQACL